MHSLLRLRSAAPLPSVTATFSPSALSAAAFLLRAGCFHTTFSPPLHAMHSLLSLLIAMLLPAVDVLLASWAHWLLVLQWFAFVLRPYLRAFSCLELGGLFAESNLVPRGAVEATRAHGKDMVFVCASSYVLLVLLGMCGVSASVCLVCLCATRIVTSFMSIVAVIVSLCVWYISKSIAVVMIAC